MTDRTGGPTSPNYIHRKRPESYEEDDEEGSEGEEVVALKARAGGPGHPHNDDEDERLGRQDLALARSLRLRAEGLEKVVISMLDQPPPIHPINDEDILTPPTSPKLTASNAAHPHRLPNGVRLRLALGTIVNDLFARQAPSPPYRHTHATNVTTPNTAKSAAASTPPDHSPQSSVVPSPSDLPNALATLAPVSGAFAPVRRSSPIRPSQNQQQQYHNYSPGRSNSGHQGYTQTNSPRNMHMQYPSIQHQQQSSQPLGPPMQSTNRPHASQRTRALYAVGADPSTANSPPAFRCPRHLHTGCEICVEAKSPPRQTGSSNSRGRGSSFGGAGGGGVGTSPRSANNRPSMIGASTGSGVTWRTKTGIVAPGGGGITGWEDGSGIGSGLLRPGVRGSALRRKVREDGKGSTGAGNTKLSKLIPRFIRLSALVAAELGREARGEEDTNASEDGKERDGVAGRGATPSASGSANMGTPRSDAGWTIGGGRYSPLPPPASPSLASRNSRQPQQAPSAQTQAQNRMYEFALRPSSEWYMLLAGLLTRAVLEGYLTAGWTGLQSVQCLLLVGLGINEHAGKENVDPAEIDEDDVDDDEFSSLDPDELPNLVDAIKILFPSLRDQENEFAGIKSKGEEEYEMEMHERLKRFYDIPASTPDCATHMEDLAWQYPAEPVERAAVRFCEAIAKWRGKPELETYKKKPQPAPIDALNTSPGGTATAMTIESLVHSNPSSPMIGDNSNAGNGDRSRRKRLKKPSIDVYFIQSSPSSAAGSAPPVTPRRGSFSWNRSGSNLGNMNMNNSSGTNSNNKRYRDDDGGRPESAKRMFV